MLSYYNIIVRKKYVINNGIIVIVDVLSAKTDHLQKKSTESSSVK